MVQSFAPCVFLRAAENECSRVILSGARCTEASHVAGPTVTRYFAKPTNQLMVSGGIGKAPNEFLDLNRHRMSIIQL